MTDPPDTKLIDEYKVVEKSNNATVGVFQIARRYGLDPAIVANIFVTMPVKEDGEMTFLERLDQGVEMVSSAVNDKFSFLTPPKKMALKFRVMSELLILKAGQLE